MKRIGIPILFSLTFLIILFSYQWGSVLDKNLRVVICDVGQGDAIYIKTPGGVDILIDGGPGTKVLDCLSKYMPFWDREIELVFATHPDADHITGLVSVLKSYRVKEFNSIAEEKDTKVFGELKKLIADNKIPYKTLTAGDRFRLSDGVEIKTFWPEKGYKNSDTNNHSLVQVLSYGDFDLLLTGDVSYEILNTLEIGDNIEIFKLPHHGSRTGLDTITAAKIRAEIAVISAGRNNPYNHPHQEVISLLEQYKMEYLRTDERGSIEIVTNGRESKVVN